MHLELNGRINVIIVICPPGYPGIVKHVIETYSQVYVDRVAI